MSTTEAARAEATPAPQAGRAHIQALDGVRGLAILSVFLYHAWPDLSHEWRGGATLNMLASAGPFGVDLFFVLSGFLITGILLDAREGRRYFRNFYARRALRLFPVYYLYLLVVAFALPIFHRAIHTSMPDYSGPWWWYVLYFCNWKPNWGWGDPWLGHIWSLAVEEQFYLVWPTVVLLAGRKRLWPICLAIIAGATTLRFEWAFDGVPWNQIYRLTITRADTMAWGALGALALRSPAWRTRAARLAPPSSSPARPRSSPWRSGPAAPTGRAARFKLPAPPSPPSASSASSSTRPRRAPAPCTRCYAGRCSCRSVSTATSFTSFTAWSSRTSIGLARL